MRNPSSTGGLSSAPVEPPLALGDDRPSAVAAGLAGHGHHPLHERGLVVGDASALPVRAPRLAQCSARPPLRDHQPLLHLLDRTGRRDRLRRVPRPLPMRLALSSQSSRLGAELFQDRASGMGPTHICGGYLPVPWARTAPPAHPPPPTGSGYQQRKHAFWRALHYRPAREVDRFPTPARRTFVQDGPEAASVRSDWPCRNGSGLMEFERSRCRARAARLSSSRPTFAASPIPPDSRLR